MENETHIAVHSGSNMGIVPPILVGVARVQETNQPSSPEGGTTELGRIILWVPLSRGLTFHSHNLAFLEDSG